MKYQSLKNIFSFISAMLGYYYPWAVKSYATW